MIIRLFLSLIFITACVAGYFLYPYWTLLRIDGALKSQDAATLEALIDWPQVRAGLKSDIRTQIVREVSSGSGLEALGTMLGSAYVDGIIDGSVTSSVLTERLKGGGSFFMDSLAERGFLTPTTFQAVIKLDDLNATLILQMSGLTWRITRVLVSPSTVATLAKRNSSSVSVQRPQVAIEGISPAISSQEVLTYEEMTAVKSHVQKCWNVPSQPKRSPKIVPIAIRIDLNENGTLSKEPSVLSMVESEYEKALATTALTAIRKCAPFTMLPAAKYAVWKAIVIDFDPRPAR